MEPLVLELTQDELQLAKQFYQDYLLENSSPYVLFFAKQDTLTITAYKSGKMVIAGKEAQSEYEMWIVKLNKQSKFDKLNIIGSDEVGTGDFFGPVVVVAAYVKKEQIDYLLNLGINDSKQLSDKKIVRLALRIKNEIPYSLLILDNVKYNELIDKGYNLNKLKAMLHNHAIIRLLNKIKVTPDKIVVDQFCSPSNYFEYVRREKKVIKDLTFQTKAESKYLSVACASIIARYVYLQKLDEMSRDLGFKLQKGASNLVDDQILKIIDLKGKDYLYNIGKLHFKNYTKL